MSIKPPPRFVVHSAHAHEDVRRRRLLLTAAWIASLLIIAGVTFLLTAHSPLRLGHRGTDPALEAQNDALKQQLATLRQARAVDTVATRRLQNALADRDKQISDLRADLAFYSRLVGGGKRDGLQLQFVHLSHVEKAPRAWDMTLTLTQNPPRYHRINRSEISGLVTVAIEGIRDHRVVRLEWAQLVGKDGGDGLTFSFKYFQQLHGTLMLPAGFTPNRLLISVAPKGAANFTRTVSWTDARKQTETIHVQQQ